MSHSSLIHQLQHSIIEKYRKQHKQHILNTRRLDIRIDSLLAIVGFPNIIDTIQLGKQLDIGRLFTTIASYFKQEDYIYTSAGLNIIIKLLNSPSHSSQCKTEICRLNIDQLLIQNFIHGEFIEFHLLFSKLLCLLLDDQGMFERLNDYHYHILLFISHLISSHPTNEELVVELFQALRLLSRFYQIDSETVLVILQILSSCSDVVLEKGLLLLLRYYEKVYDEIELGESYEEMLRVCRHAFQKENGCILESCIKILYSIFKKELVIDCNWAPEINEWIGRVIHKVNQTGYECCTTILEITGRFSQQPDQTTMLIQQQNR